MLLTGLCCCLPLPFLLHLRGVVKSYRELPQSYSYGRYHH